MAITKETFIDKIEIVGESRIVQVRQATIIKEDDVVIGKSFHRHTITPDRDPKDEDAEVQAVCGVVWTDDVKSKYMAEEAISRQRY